MRIPFYGGNQTSELKHNSLRQKLFIALNMLTQSLLSAHLPFKNQHTIPKVVSTAIKERHRLLIDFEV